MLWNVSFQIEQSKKYSAMMKRPKECDTEESYTDLFRHAWAGLTSAVYISSNEDKCAKYYQASMIHPMLEVSPMKVYISYDILAIRHEAYARQRNLFLWKKVFFMQYISQADFYLSSLKKCYSFNLLNWTEFTTAF